jgi:ribonuclease HI
MRVFTDGSCTKNGQKGAKAGYAVWFPENPAWSEKHLVPANEPQTNNRGELSAIRRAVQILIEKGCLNDNIVVYSDSNYSIDCLTKWIPGWVSRGWKTADGKDVSNRDLIEETAGLLSRFASYRFQHVRAHTGGTDEISRHNDVVDRMAAAVVAGVDEIKEVVVAAEDELYPGCPLRLMGPPVRSNEVAAWMRDNLATLDAEIVNRHLVKAFAEMVKTRDVNITKTTSQKVAYLRAERAHLQISQVVVEKIE